MDGVWTRVPGFNGEKTDFRHHKQCKSVQMAFFNHVKALTNVIEKTANPFNDESKDLLVLDSRDIADPLVVDAMLNLKKTGQKQYNTFVS